MGADTDLVDIVVRSCKKRFESIMLDSKVKSIAEKSDAQWIVFDRELSAPQVRNLEKMTERIIKDRTGVILDIFAQHAKSNESKTQIEIEFKSAAWHETIAMVRVLLFLKPETLSY